MRAQDVMTTGVATIRSDASIAEAVRRMVDDRISGLPVVDAGGEIVGMLTEGDLLRRVELATLPQRPAWLNFLRGPDLAAEEYVRTHTRTVADLMTPEPVTVDAAAPLQEVVGEMQRHRVRRVPVLRDGRLVGIVSRADLVRALGASLPPAASPARSDAEIERDFKAELDRQSWTGNIAIEVAVEQGVLRLSGVAPSDAVRLALRAAAEQIPGVVAVENAVAVEMSVLTIGV